MHIIRTQNTFIKDQVGHKTTETTATHKKKTSTTRPPTLHSQQRVSIRLCKARQPLMQNSGGAKESQPLWRQPTEGGNIVF